MTLVVLLVAAVYLWRRVPLATVRPVGERLLRYARARRARPAPSPTLAPTRPLTDPPPPPAAGLRLADVAFDYQRAVLELRDVSDETKNRALFVISRVIVPLVGRTRLADVTVEFEQGTEDVLAQWRDDPDAAVYVWRDMLRWGRVHCAPVPYRRRPRPSNRSRTDSDFDL